MFELPLNFTKYNGVQEMMMGAMQRMMGGMGLGMNPMMGLSRMGGLGSMGGALFDPRAVAMNSMASGLMNGMSSATGSMLSGLSRYLPGVIDHLTPEGRLPTEKELSGRI